VERWGNGEARKHEHWGWEDMGKAYTFPLFFFNE